MEENKKDIVDENNNSNEIKSKEDEIKEEIKVAETSDKILSSLSETTSTKLERPADLNDVEDARLNFFNSYKKSKRTSNIAMGVVLVVVIAAFILIVQKSQVMKIIGYALAGVAIVGMIIFYALNKNKFPNLTKEYINNINALLNGYTFESNELSKTVTDSLEKIEQSDVISDRVYTNVNKIGSRNVVYGGYKDAHFRVADLAVYSIQEKNKQVPVFVGKYLTYPNTLDFSGRIIISLSGEKPIDLANDIDDLKELYKEENLTIYGPEGLDYKDILGSKFISNIKKIEIKDALLNINFVIWGGHSAAYLSYSDGIMALPFDKPFEKACFIQYRDNFMETLSILSLINKKKN